MQLQQSDRAQRLRKELTLAQTMGYSARLAWQRVAWPQIRKQLQWPLLAVLAYGLSVVDVAMLIGPTSPPTLALLTWQWLQDADTAVNAQGAAAAWLLLGLVALCTAALHAGTHLPVWRARWTRGVPVSRGLQIRRTWWSPGNSAAPLMLVVMLLPAAYVAVLLALAAGSVVGVWPFPALLPQSWTLAAWQSVWESRAVLTTSFSLATYSAASALVWSVIWLEWAPAQWQRRLMQFIYIPLALPSVLWVMGLHRMAISWDVDATFAGLWLVHTLLCVPYVLLAMESPYANFNPALQAVAASLGRSSTAFLLQVKWPLLKATLLAGFAVGFSVSTAQYLATMYVGAGRFATVSTEAINLTAGGQRSMAAAFAWLQWLLPAMVFALAGLLGRPRRFK
jgi:putative thiamine transport system permease protein